MTKFVAETGLSRHSDCSVSTKSKNKEFKKSHSRRHRRHKRHHHKTTAASAVTTGATAASAVTTGATLDAASTAMDATRAATIAPSASAIAPSASASAIAPSASAARATTAEEKKKEVELKAALKKWRQQRTGVRKQLADILDGIDDNNTSWRSELDYSESSSSFEQLMNMTGRIAHRTGKLRMWNLVFNALDFAKRQYQILKGTATSLTRYTWLTSFNTNYRYNSAYAQTDALRLAQLVVDIWSPPPTAPSTPTKKKKMAMEMPCSPSSARTKAMNHLSRYLNF